MRHINPEYDASRFPLESPKVTQVSSEACQAMLKWTQTSLMTLLLAIGTISTTGVAGQPNDGELLTIDAIEVQASPRLLAHPSLGQNDFLGKVTFNLITYRSDGMAITGCLIEPRTPGKYPAIIFNHGGNGDFGALAFDLQMLQLADLAAEGYVVVASQYRGVAGNPGKDEFGGGDVNDVLNLIPLLKSRDNVDVTRIGMMGESRGGMMTYLALTRTAEIKTAVIIAGAADLVSDLTRRPEMMTVYEHRIGGSPDELRTRLTRRSAVYWPERLPSTTPMLLLHGTADWRVGPTESIRMAVKLLERAAPVRLVLFEAGDHGLTQYSHEVRQQVHGWFRHYLKQDTGSADNFARLDDLNTLAPVVLDLGIDR